ncbi:MAG: hypothetical protein LBG59_09855 [Candidatus Peribacteria bacterium]|jgi:hypothetical protein|nr:hypothetical protein [Candidatus Peribacteria bacterium]
MTESSEQSGTPSRSLYGTGSSEGGQQDAQSEGEQQDAQSLYQWAFQRGITTMPTLEEARMNDTITRAEMAKILVVITFPSTTPLTKGGRSEVTGGSHTTEQALQKEGCQSFSDLTKVNAELQSFIIQVCQLGLMGYYADGQTLKPAFSPNATITVAEVATILSRILR